MRLAKQLFQEDLAVPDGWAEMQTYRLLERCGFVRFPSAGYPLFPPLGQRVMSSIAAIIRREATRAGFDEVYLPLVQDRMLLESTGRAGLFARELMEIQSGTGRLILAPTNEEFFLELGRLGLHSYRQLPVRCFQIADKFRKIVKAKGVLRSRQFLMCDMVSLDEDEGSLRESAHRFEGMVRAVLTRFDLPAYRVARPGERYVDWLVPCPEGETRIMIEGGSARYAGPEEAEAVRASSVAMYFLFDHETPAPAGFQNREQRPAKCMLGTYGLGLQRCLHAIAHVHRDSHGLNLPAGVRPFDAAVLVLDPQEADQLSVGERCYLHLLERGFRVALDDRFGRNLAAKAALADFWGIPWKVVVGRRECETDTLTIKERGGAVGRSVPLDPERLAALLSDYLGAEGSAP